MVKISKNATIFHNRGLSMSDKCHLHLKTISDFLLYLLASKWQEKLKKYSMISI